MTTLQQIKTPFSFGLLITILFVLAACLGAPAGPGKLTQWVDPFIGTGGHGHTFPGATRPFGLVQLSPDTRLTGWDGCSGYHYTDSVVYGFSHTHLSGTGVSDYGDILLMPTTGAVVLENGFGSSPDQGYASRFDKESETAEPGFYGVHLSDHGIDVALTCTERAGFHQYTFSNSDTGNLILDLTHRDQLTGHELNIDNLAQGVLSGYRISKAWAQNQHVYFYMEFSEEPILAAREDQDGKPVKLGLRFAFGDSPTLSVKVGISSVSAANARANLEVEIPGWNFEEIRTQARESWERELSKVETEGGTGEQKTIFYTALYHSMIAPNLWSDVNGQYRGMDGKVHQATKGKQIYTVFSLWDTFRATHPLFTLLQHKRTSDFIYTFLCHYEQGGRLPVWELAANETGCMIGYHSVSVVADAYAKGIRDWDHDKMLEAMIHSAELDHFGLKSYKQNGCILAADDAESVSKTLEYAYDDWCIAQYAKALGKNEVYDTYIRRAQYYKNLFDPGTGFFRARMDGGWFGPFDPAEVNFNYTEANAWQYSLFVPHDISGLISLLGGPEKLEQHLDRLFEAPSATTGRHQADITGLIGQYAHGNEPSHHMAYLYNYVGKPWKTQERVQQILRELYTDRPDGLSGNEDCGQMSAWYVLSSMGLYPVTPGLAEYNLTTPVFDKIILHLENGNDFAIECDGKGNYIRSAQLNGSAHPRSYLSHDAIMKGGKLLFKGGDAPSGSWGVTQYPQSSIDGPPIAPTPFLDATGSTFLDSITVAVGSVCNSCTHYLQRNGEEQAQTYQEPVTLTTTTRLKVWSESPAGQTSRPIEHTFYRIPGGRSIKLNATFANQYAAGGPDALIDHLRGSGNFRTGRWQGFQGQDFEAVVDLGAVQQVEKAGAGFLQDIGSWIFYPPEVRFFSSRDGKSFTNLGTIVNRFPDRREGAYTQDFELHTDRPMRYLKVVAPYYGDCPEWHLGAGGKTWLFLDEIWIN